MQSVAELLAHAVAAGVAVEARGDRLRVRGGRSAEPIMRQLLARKPEVLAILAGDSRERATALPPQPVGSETPPDPEAKALLAAVLALLPCVNSNWQSYITTRLEVDSGSAERLRRVRDWTLAHAAFAPHATGTEPNTAPVNWAEPTRTKSEARQTEDRS